MQRQTREGTAPELAVRREAWARGLRYFVDRRPVPSLRRRADLVFPGAMVAVFIDGCFWHGCGEHGRLPKSNADWWLQKIERTRARDADTTARLEHAGWTVVRVWEHEEPVVAAATIEYAVRGSVCSKTTTDALTDATQMLTEAAGPRTTP